MAIYENQVPIRDNEAKQLLRNLHMNYVDLISNPFHDHGGPILNSKFITANKALLRTK